MSGYDAGRRPKADPVARLKRRVEELEGRVNALPAAPSPERPAPPPCPWVGEVWIAEAEHTAYVEVRSSGKPLTVWLSKPEARAIAYALNATYGGASE